MKNIKKQVLDLLTDHPELRDDRDKVIAEILSRNSNIPLDDLAAVASLYKDAASVDRYFRQVQEQNEELRGSKYQDRQQKALEKKKELGYNV